MPEKEQISFVTWPDGRVDDKSVCAGPPMGARRAYVAQWLPEAFFGNALESYSVLDALWRKANEKGARVWTITLKRDAEGNLEVDKLESGW